MKNNEGYLEQNLSVWALRGGHIVGKADVNVTKIMVIQVQVWDIYSAKWILLEISVQSSLVSTFE